MKKPFNKSLWIAAGLAALAWYISYRIKKAAGAAGAAIIAPFKAAGSAVKTKVEAVTVAAANAAGINEAGGYAGSAGQNDPLLKYNAARIAYAISKGYKAGTPDFRSPPGFPNYDTWTAANVASTSFFSWW